MGRGVCVHCNSVMMIVMVMIMVMIVVMMMTLAMIVIMVMMSAPVLYCTVLYCTPSPNSSDPYFPLSYPPPLYYLTLSPIIFSHDISTIIKIITGELNPPEGEVRRNPRLRVGIYNQVSSAVLLLSQLLTHTLTHSLT